MKLKKEAALFSFILAIGTFIVGCANSQPQPQKTYKPLLKEKAIIEKIKCLDDKCYKKELVVNLVVERVKVKINIKDKKKYKVGQPILIKVK